MPNAPVIKITVDSMRHQMLHHLSTQHLELEQMVDAELTRVAESGELEKFIASEIRRAIPDHVKNVVSRAINRMAWDEESMYAITEAARTAMLKQLARDA